jgi:hypothetical protein
VLIVMVGFVLVGIAVGVVALFVRWEREGNEQRVPLVLLALLVVESTLYFSPNAVPRGIFHPGSGSTQLRLPEVYITLALVARLIARGKPTRIGLPAGLWLAFGAWMAVGAVEGGLYHNQFSQNIYEAKSIWYVVGAYALAAGVPVRRYLDSGDLFKLGSLCVGCATLLDLMTIGHVSINFNIPLVPLQSFGSIGNEGAALFFAIGTMCFLAKMASGPVRLRDVVALIPLIVCVALADERAVLLNLAVVAAVIVIALAIGHRHGIARRFHVRSGQVVLTLLAVVAVFLAVTVIPAAADRQSVRLPLASSFEGLFHGEAKVESAQDRLNLASEAEALIPQHLFIGWGLGVQFQFYEAGTHQVQTISYAHDIVLDLWLRLGLIGLVLFVVALWASLSDGLKVWRRHPDPVTAALALALVAVLAGLILTALLEPLIDEYRFATLFGVSLGMLRACVTSMGGPPRLPSWRSEVARSSIAPGGVRWS